MADIIKNTESGKSSKSDSLQRQIEEAMIPECSPQFYERPNTNIGMTNFGSNKEIVSENKSSNEEFTCELVSAGKKQEINYEPFNQLSMIPEAFTESMSPQKAAK